MTTIEIVEEQPAVTERVYRAISGIHQAKGATAGQALDSLEAILAQQPGTEQASLIIVQRFAPDRFFNVDQQQRLEALMKQHNAALNARQQLPADEQRELDALVDAELRATIARSEHVLRQRQLSDDEKAA